jgi:hypothetical protein
MTTQPEFTQEQIAAMLEQIAAKGGSETLKMVANTANTMVKDTAKADKAADDAEKLRLHAEASDGLRVSARSYLDQAYPDDKTPTSKNQTGTMLVKWFRDVDGRRVVVDMPKVKASNPTGERLRGTKFIPIHAKLCLGPSETEDGREYLKWVGITNYSGGWHDELKKLVAALIDGKSTKGTGTADSIMIKHADINGGIATRLVDHFPIAFAKA